MKAINKKSFVINLLGVMMSGAIMYSMNPVAIAYFAAAYVERSLRYLLVLSTMAGLFLWMPLQDAIRYAMIIVLFVLVIAWVEKRQQKQKIPPILIGGIASLITIGIEIGYVLQGGFQKEELLLAGIEGVLIFALFHIFLKGMAYFIKAKKGQIPNNEEMISIVILFAVFVYAIPDLSTVEFSFKQTITYLLILIMGYKYGAGAGAIAGTALGAVLFIETGLEAMIGVMCILGISAGVFRKMGKLGAGIAFLVANVALGYFYEGALIEVTEVRAIASSVAAFFLLPRSLLYTIEAVSPHAKPDEELENRIQEVAKNKLEDFAESFKTLSKSFYQISETKSNLSKSDVNYIFDELSDKLCKGCINCNTCWKNNFYDTYKAAFSILNSAEKNGEVRREDIPASFAKQCLNLNSFLYETNRGLEMAKLNLSWHNRMAQSREAIAGQLGEVAAIIEEFSTELYESVGLDEEEKVEIMHRMRENHIDVRAISVVERRNKKQEYYLTARTVNGQCVTTREAAKVLGEVIGKRMRPSEEAKNIVTKDYETVLFVEDVDFKVLTGISKATKANESVSGDNFSFIYLNNGEMIMTLSDGMGTGEQACAESQSVIELLEQFMEAGFKEESAIKLINSVLVLRTDQQTCSTIDMSVLDLFTGICDFIKIGAAATFIKRQDWVETITSTSLPIGVLNQVDMDGVSKKLYDGDIIIMVTDGVLDCIRGEEKEKIFAHIISRIRAKNPQEIADQLLDATIEQNNYQAVDDMTILVAGVWKK